jgi:plasmid stabilization system protein ParE
MPVARRTDAANSDLREIAYQIGVESGRPLASEKIIDELVDCREHLAQLSHISKLGTMASELGSDVRLYHHRRWVIVFRYTDEGVIVLRSPADNRWRAGLFVMEAE